MISGLGRCVLGVALACGALASGWAQGAASGAVPLERVSLGDIGGWIVVKATLGGVEGRWLLDTGSTANLVSGALTDRLGLARGGSVRAETALGTLQGARAALPPLQVGALQRTGQTALVLDLRTLLGPAAEAVDGVLGVPFLADLAVALDLRGWQLVLREERAGAPACPDGLQPLALRLHRGLPVIEAGVPGREPLPLLLDTGNPAAVLLIEREAPASAEPGLPLPDGTRLAVARQVSVGPLERLQVPVVRLQAAGLRQALGPRVVGLAGTALLDGTRWLLRLQAGQACVEAGRVQMPGGFGLTLARREGRLVIGDVLPGGPAQAARLRAGDEVVQWAGGPADGTLFELWARVQGQDRITLRVGLPGREVSLQRTWFAPAWP